MGSQVGLGLGYSESKSRKLILPAQRRAKQGVGDDSKGKIF